MAPFASPPSTFVDGTSESIHDSSTIGNASAPWIEKNQSRIESGRKNQPMHMAIPLAARMTGMSKGQRKQRLSSAATSRQSGTSSGSGGSAALSSSTGARWVTTLIVRELADKFPL